MTPPTPADAAAFDLLAKLDALGLIVIAYGPGELQGAAWGRDAVEDGLVNSLLDELFNAIARGRVLPKPKQLRPRKRRKPRVAVTVTK